MEEIKEKIQDTSETSDTSVQNALLNAKDQVKKAEDWDQEFSQMFGEGKTEGTVGKLQELILKATDFEAKTPKMEEVAKVYKQNEKWIHNTDTFMTITKHHRKHNTVDNLSISIQDLESMSPSDFSSQLVKSRLSELQQVKTKVEEYQLKVIESIEKDTDES